MNQIHKKLHYITNILIILSSGIITKQKTKTNLFERNLHGIYQIIVTFKNKYGILFHMSGDSDGLKK